MRITGRARERKRARESECAERERESECFNERKRASAPLPVTVTRLVPACARVFVVCVLRVVAPSEEAGRGRQVNSYCAGQKQHPASSINKKPQSGDK